HFNYKMALAALDHPVDKIRINPGNIGGYNRYREVIRKAKAKGLPMRIGVNAGSLERELVEKHGFPCPPAMVESALRYIEIAESEGYHDLIVSLKSSDVLTAVEAYRLYAKQANYPTHIGITEAGKAPYAVTKSACGPADGGQGEYPGLRGQWPGRGTGGRSRDRRRQGQGGHLQARGDRPSRPGEGHGGRADRGD